MLAPHRASCVSKGGTPQIPDTERAYAPLPRHLVPVSDELFDLIWAEVERVRRSEFELVHIHPVASVECRPQINLARTLGGQTPDAGIRPHLLDRHNMDETLMRIWDAVIALIGIQLGNMTCAPT